MYIDSNFDYLMQGNKYSEQGTNEYYETYQPSHRLYIQSVDHKNHITWSSHDKIVTYTIFSLIFNM